MEIRRDKYLKLLIDGMDNGYIKTIKMMGLLIICCLICSCSSTGKDDTDSAEKCMAELNDRYRGIANEYRSSKSTVSDNYIMLVDYSIPSNKPRFFVWDYSQNKIIYTLWCAHGCGRGSTDSKPEFSNEIGSNCSSLGEFLIDKLEGKSPRYGYNYHAVDGLSQSNSNARKRQLLIHSWHSVTTDSISDIDRPMSCDYRSAGCFTLTKQGYEAVHGLIKSEPKRIMLYSFNGI